MKSEVIQKSEGRLRYATENFHTNYKTTGAVIWSQSFSDARGSGTNDKAGSSGMLIRFNALITLKEGNETLHSAL